MNTTKIIRGVINATRYTVTAPVIKEDYGLYLKIEGTDLPETYEVDFSNEETAGTSVTMIGTAEDGVHIPNQFIKSGRDIFAFLYLVSEDYGRTVYKFRIPNKLRPDRTDIDPDPEEQSLIDQAISALNDAVEQTAADVVTTTAKAAEATEAAELASYKALVASDSATAAGTYATRAETAQIAAESARDTATAKAAAAATSADNASLSAANALDSASDAAISAGQASASASAAAESALDAKTYLSVVKDYAGAITVAWINGKSYNTPSSVSVITPDDLTDTPTFSCAAIPVTTNKSFLITGTGGSGSKLWVFTTSDGTIISRSASSAVMDHETLIAPDNAAWLLVSVNTSQEHDVSVTSLDNRMDAYKKSASIRPLDFVGGVKKNANTVYIDLLQKLKKYNGKSLSTSVYPNTSLFDYLDKAITSTIGTLYEAVRVRDEYGNQIAPIYIDFDADDYLSANMAFGYKADGTPDQRYNAGNVTDGELILASTTCYLVFLTFSNLAVKIYSAIGTDKTEYHVGVGQEYTTFHACIEAIKGDKSQKVIHVYGGTYDVLSELGGSTFLDGLDGTENWYDVCDVIPPNTHVIGHGNVIFDLTIPSGTPTEKAVLLSPINMVGSATVENVTINCDGGRYCIHAEGSYIAENNNAVWKIINCKINKSNNLSGVANAIGVGLNDGNYLDIRGCVITNDGNAGLLVHDQQIVAGGFAVSPRVSVESCAFDVSSYPIVMSSTHSGAISGAVLEMTVINCFCNNKYMRKIGDGKKDVFHATYINTPHRTQNGSGIIDIIADTEYNNFSLNG